MSISHIAVEQPAGLTPAHELPVTVIPAVPHWSENYWFIANAPETETSIFLHCGRAPTADLWRQTMIVHLPDGELLVSKAFGRGASERGPGGPTLAFDCVTPWNQWRVRFDGAVQRVSPGRLGQGLLQDGVFEPMTLDLTFDGISPMWVLDEKIMAAQDWGDLHYQQLLSVNGTLEFGGSRVPFEGTATRDHTRGPRDFLPADRHVTASCFFPSGRGFFIFDARSDRGQMTVAAVLDSGRLHEAELVDVPLMASRDDAWRGYSFGLNWDGGSCRIDGQPLQPIQMGLAGFSEFTIGFDPEVSYCGLYEAHSEFSWDGEVGHGWTERTLREHQRR